MNVYKKLAESTHLRNLIVKGVLHTYYNHIWHPGCFTMHYLPSLLPRQNIPTKSLSRGKVYVDLVPESFQSIMFSMTCQRERSVHDSRLHTFSFETLIQTSRAPKLLHFVCVCIIHTMTMGISSAACRRSTLAYLDNGYSSLGVPWMLIQEKILPEVKIIMTMRERTTTYCNMRRIYAF